GQAARSFRVYQQVYRDGKPVEGMVVDRNGDGIINDSDRYYYKNPAAPWTFGLASRLQWRNLDFSFSLRANLGNYVFNDVEAGQSNISTAGIYTQEYLSNRIKYAMDKNFSSWDKQVVLSDYFVQNASFLKCDNITVGYSFADLFGTKLSGRVYATASNVFTITKYDGVDPEVDGGIDNNIYPRPFSGLVGLTLNF
ncbi:MAG: SusC/RagA family protein, partial [Bacteroidales bacterium]|nr:SusC/RagA family protein [Bacteroidales bacterium]